MNAKTNGGEILEFPLLMVGDVLAVGTAYRWYFESGFPLLESVLCSSMLRLNAIQIQRYHKHHEALR